MLRHLTGTLTPASAVHPPAHAFSQGHGVSVSIIHLPHLQSRRDSTPQPWPCNRLSFRVEKSHGHYPKSTEREREMAYHSVGNEHTRLFASGFFVAGLIHHLRWETLISLSLLTILTTVRYYLTFLAFTSNSQRLFSFFLHFTVTAIRESPRKVSNLDYWEIVVKYTYSHKMLNSASSLIIDLGRYQAGCDISRDIQQSASLVFFEK